MRIYLAAPYTHKDKKVVAARVDLINTAAAKLMQKGHIVFSPISHSHYIAVDNDLPTDYKFWLEMNHSFIDWCEAIYVLTLDGWLESAGIQDEIDYCAEINKPVFYIGG